MLINDDVARGHAASPWAKCLESQASLLAEAGRRKGWGIFVHAVFSIQEEVVSREPMNNAGKLALLYSVVNGF